jgi:hypothetical protein
MKSGCPDARMILVLKPFARKFGQERPRYLPERMEEIVVGELGKLAIIAPFLSFPGYLCFDLPFQLSTM